MLRGPARGAEAGVRHQLRQDHLKLSNASNCSLAQTRLPHPKKRPRPFCAACTAQPRGCPQHGPRLPGHESPLWNQKVDISSPGITQSRRPTHTMRLLYVNPSQEPVGPRSCHLHTRPPPEQSAALAEVIVQSPSEAEGEHSPPKGAITGPPTEQGHSKLAFGRSCAENPRCTGPRTLVAQDAFPSAMSLLPPLLPSLQGVCFRSERVRGPHPERSTGLSPALHAQLCDCKPVP